MDRTNPAHFIPRGPQDATLPAEPIEAVEALASALEKTGEDRFNEISEILIKWPSFIPGWAKLGECSENIMQAYAAYRVGYHRGLDKLRGSGWKGSGMVRWEHPENHGFLLALYGLHKTAGKIGETKEEERCEHFLHQLDPDWPPTELKGT